MNMRIISLALAFFFAFDYAHAAPPPPPDMMLDLSPVVEPSPAASYRQKMQVVPPGTVVPNVVEVALPSQFIERNQYLVIENGTDRTVPSLFDERYSVSPVPLSAYTDQPYSDGTSLIDKSQWTGVQFDLPPEGEGVTVITLSGASSFQASGVSFDLERNVALPTSIEVRAAQLGQAERIILSRTKMTSGYISFIPTTAQTWTIRLTYAQPLKINELSLIQDDPERSVARTLRFLAQPGMSYTIYQNPDSPDMLYLNNSGDLYSNEGVVRVVPGPVTSNERYVPSDSDEDGISDMYDNCVSTMNSDQEDIDANGRGDACEDFDRDGYMNNVDNCPNLPNYDQSDEDYDGIGDVCDTEESRLTERLPWVPWAGMGIAAFVLIGLFTFVAMRPMRGSPQSDSGSLPEDT